MTGCEGLGELAESGPELGLGAEEFVAGSADHAFGRRRSREERILEKSRSPVMTERVKRQQKFVVPEMVSVESETICQLYHLGKRKALNHITAPRD